MCRFLCGNGPLQEEVQGLGNRALHVYGGGPGQQTLGVADAGFAVRYILVTLTVVATALHLVETGEGGEVVAQGVGLKVCQQDLGQLADASLIDRITYVDDLAVTQPPLFSMIRNRASMPSTMSVKQRFWVPPSTSLMGVPSTRLRMSW